GHQTEIDLVIPHPLHEMTRTLPLGEEYGASLVKRHQQQPLRIHIKERGRSQDIPELTAVSERIHFAGGQPVPVAKHATFGEARRARGVLNIHRVIEYYLYCWKGRAVALLQHICPRPVGRVCRNLARIAVWL